MNDFMIKRAHFLAIRIDFALGIEPQARFSHSGLYRAYFDLRDNLHKYAKDNVNWKAILDAMEDRVFDRMCRDRVEWDNIEKSRSFLELSPIWNSMGYRGSLESTYEHMLWIYKRNKSWEIVRNG